MPFDFMKRLVDDEPEGWLHGRHDPAQSHQPHQSKPRHGLARSERTRGKHAIEPIGEGRSRAYRIHWPSPSKTLVL